jgi:truncated hemoglobin YjbI
MDPKAPLYYWQLFSLLGYEPIEQLVTKFYERVYADNQDPDFKAAFTRISGIEHHIDTQASFWIDAFGGGKHYHGSDHRLKFHHTTNAGSVMNADGSRRWMHHMGETLVSCGFSTIDPRIKPCMWDFLRTKVIKYSRQHNWTFDEGDFEAITRDSEIIDLYKYGYNFEERNMAWIVKAMHASEPNQQ